MLDLFVDLYLAQERRAYILEQQIIAANRAWVICAIIVCIVLISLPFVKADKEVKKYAFLVVVLTFIFGNMILSMLDPTALFIYVANGLFAVSSVWLVYRRIAQDAPG